MAQSGSASPGGSNDGLQHSPRCRYFALGVCNRGSNCPFAHERPSIPVCRYFQQGFCFRGNECWYEHSQAPQVSENATEPPQPLLQPRPELRLVALDVATMHSMPEEPSISSQHGRETGIEHLGTREGVDSSFSDLLNLALGNLNLNSTLEPGPHPDTASQPDSFPEQNVSELPRTQTSDLKEEKSRDVVCGICMEKVWDKPPLDRLFAILPNCSHSYCVNCLRTWRQNRGECPQNIIKACPECRVHSNYIIPHKFWVSEGPEKKQLIMKFKERTSQIPCKFFIQRRGHCPFRSDCIYQHQFPEFWEENWGSVRHLCDLSDNSDDEEIDFFDCAIALYIIMVSDSSILMSDMKVGKQGLCPEVLFRGLEG